MVLNKNFGDFRLSLIPIDQVTAIGLDKQDLHPASAGKERREPRRRRTLEFI